MRQLFALVPVFLLAACGGAPQGQKMPPPMVGVAHPISRQLPVERVLSGRLEAVATVSVSPQVSGMVRTVFAADGAELKVGDPILEIDPAPFQATLARVAAGVAQAEAGLRLATDTRDRNAKLVKESLVSQQIYDDSVTAAAVAAAALASAKAALATAQLDLEHTTLRAPIAGRLGLVKSSVGNVVQGGGGFPPTVVASLVAIDPVYATIDLDEVSYRNLAPRLAGGEAVRVHVGLAGESGFPHEGRVTFVDNQIDPASGSIRLRATIANPQRLLTPGAFARISLEVEPPRPVLLVHERAILAQLATRYVLVADDAGIATFRPVVLGASVDGMRVIASGLTADDRVVVNNLVMLFPGRQVNPVPASMETLQNEAVPAPAAGKADK